MRINEAFVDALIEQTTEELLEMKTVPSTPNQILLMRAWVQEMEYDRPRNRPEKILFEHLEFAIDRLVLRNKTTASV